MRKEPHLIKLDNLKRKFFFKYEIRTRLSTSVLLFTNIIFLFQQKLTLGLDNLYYKGAKSLPRTRCFITSRACATDSRLVMSRFSIRRLANAGYIAG